MCDRLVHRGPDSAGHFDDDVASLGIRRLRVIDLATGDQPLANEDGTVWAVLNGEIYNFRELREQLEATGHTFRTRSDTEVIPHLYEVHGDRFVERLAGMFALAVWDSTRRILVLARDRLGKKPLLYAERDGELTFASEHEALLAGLTWRPAIDRRAIRMFLQLGYVAAPYDAYVGVQKLLPAHVLVWKDGESRERRYWSLPEGTEQVSDAEAVGEFRRLFTRSVERRLISDVPLGALLSGGVDSSAVVATMAAATQRVKTFSIGFEEGAFSELPHARRLAERFATEHHEFVVRPRAAEVLPMLVRRYGEPYADSSALPSYYLARETRRHVTVALDGDGGDELFAGYDRYRAVSLAAGIDALPRVVALVASAIARAAPANGPTAIRRARRLLLPVAIPPRDRYFEWMSVFDRATLAQLLEPDFAKAGRFDLAAVPGWSVQMSDGDAVARAQEIDLLLYLPNDLLVKMDIASMASSLEVRCPFLDHELVEFAARLPPAMRLRHGQKWIVKEAFRDVIPAENMDRPKQGFAVPIASWFRGELRPMLEDLVLSPTALARGYLRPGAVRRLVREHVSGRSDHGQRLWSLLVLELWHRECAS